MRRTASNRRAARGRLPSGRIRICDGADVAFGTFAFPLAGGRAFHHGAPPPGSVGTVLARPRHPMVRRSHACLALALLGAGDLTAGRCLAATRSQLVSPYAP